MTIPSTHTTVKAFLNIKGLWIVKSMSFHTRNLIGHPCDEFKKYHC